MFAERQQRMMDALNQRRAGMGWQAYLLPAAGLGLLTLLLGTLGPLCRTSSLSTMVPFFYLCCRSALHAARSRILPGRVCQHDSISVSSLHCTVERPCFEVVSSADLQLVASLPAVAHW